MCESVQYLPFQQQFDVLSEPSTDGDDTPLLQNYGLPIKKNIAKNKMKSSLCRNFSEKGFCPYGAKCQFAHGLQELRCKIDQNSYKTKSCNSFWKKNYCPYGFRCNFSHCIPLLEEQVQPENNKTYGYRQIVYPNRNKIKSRLLSLLE